MYKPKLPLFNYRGQILIEAIISCLLMGVVMVAFAKLIEAKKTQSKSYKKIQDRLEAINGESFSNESAK